MRNTLLHEFFGLRFVHVAIPPYVFSPHLECLQIKHTQFLSVALREFKACLTSYWAARYSVSVVRTAGFVRSVS